MSSPPSDAAKPLCIDFDPDIFFEDEVVNLAKAICHECPIRVECGVQAIERDEKWGVWGGMSADDRKKITTPRTRVKCPGCLSTEVYQIDTHNEVCGSCGLSWKV